MLKKICMLILPVLLIAACSTTNGTTVQTGDNQVAMPTPSLAETAAEQPDESKVAPLEPFRPLTQTVEFTASDGTALQGTYYPSDLDNASLVILMHWARGDQTDYTAIAGWLQNRGGVENDKAGQETWQDNSWFPEIPFGSESYAVFTFSFRDCNGGCAAFHPQEWLDDAQSAVEYAWGLSNIDQNRIVVVGASIGADGAADGCLYLNQQHPGSCKGAFSISPGSYLTETYADVVKQLGAPAVCLYAPSDGEAVAACANWQADNYTSYEIGNVHGMLLIDPQVQPNPLDILLQFLRDNLG